MSDKYQAAGVHWAIANPQIETNSAVNVWENMKMNFTCGAAAM